MNQEQLIQLQMIEQEVNQLSQQSQLIEQNISELMEISNSLDEIEKLETKDILTNIGKKIYIPVEIKEKKLIVEVGDKNFVKKSIPEVTQLIDGQIIKLNSAKLQISERLRELESQMNLIVMEASKKKEGKHECHDKDCKHED